jgi:predicted 3-demethylubiquinone-9 3-methyltransferase (glyoxalase superfamily)
MGQKITPNIWCNNNAKEMADFYVSAFPDGKIHFTSYYPKSKEEGLADFQENMAGKELVVEFEVAGKRFSLINAGDTFKPNPSISFFVNFDPSRDDKARERLDELWSKLSDGGQALMELNSYPFSEHYGWIQDKYGVSWQLIMTDPNGEERPMIVPSLLFSGPNTNRAEEAIDYYTATFENSKKGNIAKYEADTQTAKAGSIMYGDFQLDGDWLAAMDSGAPHEFNFTEGISLSISCKDQEEIDYFWEKLSKVPESEQCGWCKDQFGVSWQVVPENVGELLKKPGAFQNMMKMHKLVIADY